MKSDKFYTVPYDGRNDPRMRVLREQCGGIVAYARWHVLLELLYQLDGVVDNSSEVFHNLLLSELEMNDEELDFFLEKLAEIDFIDAHFLHAENHSVSHGVADQLAYKKTKSEAGKQGGRPSAKSKTESRPKRRPKSTQ